MGISEAAKKWFKRRRSTNDPSFVSRRCLGCGHDVTEHNITEGQGECEHPGCWCKYFEKKYA